MKITVFTLIIMMSTAAMSQVRQIPLKDFFKNPEKDGYQISPDGRYFSYMAPYESRMNVFVQKVGDANATRITSETERDISGYFWGNNNVILYLKDFAGDENYHVVTATIDGKNVKDVTPFPGVRAEIIDDLEEDDDHIIVGMNKRNPEVFDPYRLNINTGDLTILAENPGNIMEWATDHEGKIRMATATDGVITSLLYREKETDEFKTILTTNFKESVSPLFFTFDNKMIYATSNIGRDKSAIVKFDPATAKEVEMLFEHPEVDVTSMSYSHKRKVLTTITYTTWKRERKFLDKEMERIFNRLSKDLGKYEIAITGANKNEDKFLVRTFSDRSMGAYYFYDAKTDKLTKLSDVSPWIKEEEMAEMKPVTYKTRDGYTINGYLTLPKGKDPKNLPVIVNPHGGPWARDHWGFNPEIQFLANRGYAVFQMNFRGSTGYGRKFWESSFKQWGQTMQNDITDGVNWLVKEGIADPKRVAIYGASYGGYATLAGVAYTPDLYACAVDYVGVSNLFTFMQTIPPYWKPFLAMMYEMVGDPEKDKEMMTKASPVFHVDKIKCPLFVVQGRMDPRVNIAESDQIVDALKKRGVEVQYMVKDNEGHGFHNEENQFEFYEAMEKFFDQHLKK